jgi:NitT/TauT family transport system substrate-binding protein
MERSLAAVHQVPVADVHDLEFLGDVPPDRRGRASRGLVVTSARRRRRDQIPGGPMRRTTTRAAALLAGALLLAACGANTGGSTASTTTAEDGTEMTAVTLGVVPIVDVAPVYLGVEQGFFEEQGIDLTIESGQGGAAIVPGVVSGQFQFGFSNNTSLLIARSTGLPLKVVAPGNFSTGEDGNDFSGIVVPEGSDITDAAGLAGRSVSVNTLKNVGDTTVRQSVEKAGGDPSSVNFVELAFPDMPGALSSGQVDAAWVVEPFLTIAQQQGATLIASNLVDTDENFMIASYFTSEQTLEADPDLVERFTTALNQSLDYAQENPDAVRDVIGTYTQIDAAVAEELVLPKWSSELNEETLTLLADLAEQDGLVEDPVDPQSLLP